MSCSKGAARTADIAGGAAKIFRHPKWAMRISSPSCRRRFEGFLTAAIGRTLYWRTQLNDFSAGPKAFWSITTGREKTGAGFAL